MFKLILYTHDMEIKIDEKAELKCWFIFWEHLNAPLVFKVSNGAHQQNLPIFKKY